MPIFFYQALGRSGAVLFGLSLEVLVECLAGAAADSHGKFIGFQVEQRLIRLSRLQCQGAEPERDGKACAELGI